MTKNELKELTKEVVLLSRTIGNWMKDQKVNEAIAETKTNNNLVTYVDKESELRFVEGLRKLIPEAGFVAEEGTGEANVGGLNWVIDPLDGTTNFVHGVPIWCTSIGLVNCNQPLLGVIFDPSRNEMFEASKGNGSYLNENPIRVSNIMKLEESLMVTGFPYDDFGKEEQYMKLLKHMLHLTRGMRRLGSAALDLAWTACGRFEGFYEYGLNPWDVAAGTIIVQEAGGKVTEFHGGDNPIFGEDLSCTNGHIHEEFNRVLQSYF